MKVVSLSPLWRDELAAQLAPGITLLALDASDTPRVTKELADAAVVLTTRFDRGMAEKCGALELIVCPAAGIALAVLSFNLLGDALRDALDPRLERP